MLKTLKILFWFGVFCLSGIFMVASAAYLYLSPQLPSAESYREVQLETPLRILTADHKLIEEIGVRRDPISYDEIPPLMVQAVVASEDSRFYSHPGVDFRGLVRGFYGFLRGVNLGGGSTITMQLANNISFDSDNVYARKLKEIPFALRIQQELSKEEILTLYLNLVYFGQGADGISAAAAVYYDKTVDEMTLGEFATMVSLLPCPSVCNPVTDPERSKVRRDVVINKMLAQGMIDRNQHAAALAEPIEAKRHLRNIEVNAPYVAEMVRQDLFELYGDDIYRLGIEVVTSIDSNMQIAATNALRSGLENYYDRRHGYRGPEAKLPVVGPDPRERWLQDLNVIPTYGNHQPAVVTEVNERSLNILFRDGSEHTIEWSGLEWARPFISRDNAWPPPQQASDVAEVGDLIRVRRAGGELQLGQVPEIQGALVSVSPDNGDILALVGGYDFQYSQVNRALASRPPGSGFKAFLYGAAIEDGYNPATLINDAPFARGEYRPQNFERNFVGPITLRNAFKDSRNVPAVRLYDQLGTSKLFDFAARFGFNTDTFPRNDLTVALGSQDVQPLQMATGYAMIANGGHRIEPTFIKSITTLEGVVFRSRQPTVCDNCSAEQATETATDASVRAESMLNGEGDIAIQDREALPEQQLAPLVAEQVTDPRVAYIMNTMLRSVVEEGSGRRVNREFERRDLMGKTGTTNGPAEVWFTGFNRDIATSVFVGFDQPEALGEAEQGATVAVPIWIDFMKVALAGTPENIMPRPNGLVDHLIDRDTGEIARPGQANTMFEVFMAETAPADNARRPADSSNRNNNENLSTETIF
ncbi:penicillin-binding protein 1A [Pseudohongiella sp.]|uniref:Penicillin-binding protein 1A n=1 Tax=marine sediment metagenome TaxID=412755 RepID=A0A0F9VP58_9ZZZZ|nr:PBP1A family penicillin-binding protein [Pseudohongiella sp.]HDZ10099.1 PBP1A family penicillin-binding protein [Pseudohongiella sp.]HEA63448.1 PBP1A family penicillin-binding protein [Pseudohongiella sp.]